jgi:hypothetical protein
MALYRGLPGREEDADDPEKIVRRVQEVSAVLYHLDQVGGVKPVTKVHHPVGGAGVEPCVEGGASSGNLDLEEGPDASSCMRRVQ